MSDRSRTFDRGFAACTAVTVLCLLCHLLSVQHWSPAIDTTIALRSNGFQTLGGFLGALWALLGYLRGRGAGRSGSVVLIGLACLSNGIADGLWSYLEWKQLKPFPSVADYFYLAVNPLVLGAVLCLPTRPLSPIARLRVGLDGLLVLMSVGTFSWRYVLAPTLFDASTGLLGRVIATAYPVGDLLLVFCLVILLFRAGTSHSATVSFGMLGVGILAQTIADTAFLYKSLNEGYTTGSWIDLGWPAFCLVSGLAAHRLGSVPAPAAGSQQRPDTANDGPLALVRAALPYFLVPPVGMLFLSTILHDRVMNVQEIGVVVGSSLLVVLILARQFLFLAENQGLYRQTRRDADNLKLLNDELQAAQAELVHSAKMASLGTLSAGVAHELNQPVAIARGIAQQLLAESDLPDYAREDLRLIETQTGRMMQIIQHLRTFCRTTGHGVEPYALGRIFRDSLTLIGAQLKNHGVTLEFEVDGDGPMVAVNANEIEQVFLNLITNARDAMEGRDGARLMVRVRTEAQSVIATVSDNGPGVAPEALERIFDPFFTTKEVGKGTGLGLSISRNLIAKNGGTLTVHNDGGAVFTITLPAVAEDAQPTSPISHARKAA
jgi:signal transduction histidine kinase